MLLCTIVSDGGYPYGPNHGKKSWHTLRRSWQETFSFIPVLFSEGCWVVGFCFISLIVSVTVLILSLLYCLELPLALFIEKKKQCVSH